MAGPTFWDNQARAQQLLQELKQFKRTLEPFDQARSLRQELSELSTMVEPADETSLRHLTEETDRLERLVGTLEFQRLFNGPHDDKSAILSINAGAGGTEACDWAEMLLRMFTRWGESRGYAVELIDMLPGEEAGIRNATMIMKGEHAYGRLRSEVGVHRLVRISPFDSNKRRHTSFASVDAIPEFEEEIAIEVKPEEIRVDTFRSGGAGGQSVNKTDSAVRITHLPTGIVVQCQNERSQIQNRATALKVLRARLYELEQQKQDAELEKHHAEKRKIEWGSQIRSYVLHPYNMVKDHRTDVETGNTTAVLDGALDQFMEAYLRWKAGQAPDAQTAI